MTVIIFKIVWFSKLISWETPCIIRNLVIKNDNLISKVKIWTKNVFTISVDERKYLLIGNSVVSVVDTRRDWSWQRCGVRLGETDILCAHTHPNGHVWSPPQSKRLLSAHVTNYCRYGTNLPLKPSSISYCHGVKPFSIWLYADNKVNSVTDWNLQLDLTIGPSPKTSINLFIT